MKTLCYTCNRLKKKDILKTQDFIPSLRPINTLLALALFLANFGSVLSAELKQEEAEKEIEKIEFISSITSEPNKKQNSIILGKRENIYSKIQLDKVAFKKEYHFISKDNLKLHILYCKLLVDHSYVF